MAVVRLSKQASPQEAKGYGLHDSEEEKYGSVLSIQEYEIKELLKKFEELEDSDECFPNVQIKNSNAKFGLASTEVTLTEELFEKISRRWG